MVKRACSSERIKKQAAVDHNLFLHDELVAAVCKYFCRGMPVAEIRDEVERKLGISLNREEPYRLIAFAAQRGWLRFQAPLSHEVADQIKDRFPKLANVRVVRTGVSDDISYHVASMLMDEVCSLSRMRSTNSEVHIGFAGGVALRKSARMFSEMLKEPREDLPKKIVFHAMVAGFNMQDPSTDPNGFFAYFAGEPALQVKTSFLGLLAPGIVKTGEIEKLRSIEYIRDAYERAREIDIVVTSAGGHWQEGHSGLRNLYSLWAPQSLEQLNRAGCIGDMMWRPLGKDGPLDVRTDMRTVTLMELSDLPGFIKQKKRVLLLLGPCGNCGGPKEDVLKAILAHKQRLITHLVVDSRSARGLMS
jgi:DNA-binding transcriptional regulator LsrR (DeoR family)